MNEKTRKVLKYCWNIAGYGVLLLSVFFIVQRFSGPEFVSLFGDMPCASFIIVGIATIVYSAGNGIIAAAWAVLLGAGGDNREHFLFAVRIYLRSGIVKYLPGNIFHFAGRHIMAKERGVSQGDILKANILEVAGIIICAAIILGGSVGAGVMKLPAIMNFYPDSTVVIWAAGVGAVLCGALLLWGRGRRYLLSYVSPDNWYHYGAALLFYGVFFIITGIVLQCITGAVSGNGLFRWEQAPLFIAVFSLSWIAGFVVPGAPGGLGVREFIILLMLSPQCGETPALSAALLLRAVTVGGDVLAFLYSLCCRNPVPDRS